MMQRLRAYSQRVQRSAARVIADADSFVFGPMTIATPWNAVPCVNTTAIATHGKYHQRLREHLT